MEFETNPFGSYIRKLRTENHMTLRTVAEALAISPPYLSDIEKGNRNPPDYDKLVIMTQLYHMTQNQIDHLMDLAGQSRGNLAPDLEHYIVSNPYLNRILRLARDLNTTEDDWRQFIIKQEVNALCRMTKSVS